MWGNNCRVERSLIHLFIIKCEENSFQCNPWLSFDLIFQHYFPTQRDRPKLANEEHWAWNVSPFWMLCSIQLCFSFALLVLFLICEHQEALICIFAFCKSFQLSVCCFSCVWCGYNTYRAITVHPSSFTSNEPCYHMTHESHCTRIQAMLSTMH